MSNPTRTEADITTGLLALIAYAGNASAAARSLKAEGKMDIGPQTLTMWARERYRDRYEELREKYAEKIEGQLVADLREMAGVAIEVERLALEKARERLEGDNDDDPARTASHAARVTQSSVDKMLSLSGRPTSIREDRNMHEVLRSLVAKGILTIGPGDAAHAQQAEAGDGGK